MSSYREFLSPVQNMALDIMLNTGEGSTEALVSAREIMNDSIKKVVDNGVGERWVNYIVFYADFENETTTVKHFFLEKDMLEFFPSPEIQECVLKNGVYFGTFETYHLLKIKV